jgi:hypothetical protein
MEKLLFAAATGVELHDVTVKARASSSMAIRIGRTVLKNELSLKEFQGKPAKGNAYNVAEGILSNTSEYSIGLISAKVQIVIDINHRRDL